MLPDVMGGRNPKTLMDIHEVSEVNKPSIELSKIDGPATGEDFEKSNGKLLPSTFKQD